VEWDPEKDRANRAKHGLSFEEVQVLFDGKADCLLIYDEAHSDEEDRFLAIGQIRSGVVVVAHTEPEEDVIRIIRHAWQHEMKKSCFVNELEAASDEGRNP